MEQMRLNKYLARNGVCSRREADELIGQGVVSVNGKTASCGQSVSDADRVTVRGEPVKRADRTVVLAFYKPVGVVCTQRDAHARRKLSDFIRYPLRVTYAGRLDKDSEGLLLLTNNGDLIQAMMGGASPHEKEYVVEVEKEVTSRFLERMSDGVFLEELGIRTRKCRVEGMGKYTFRIVLTQGVNRQIRRMAQACGNRVRAIKRVRVMHIELGALRPGEYYELSAGDVERLLRDCGIGPRLEQNQDGIQDER